MPINQASTFLKFANVQMATEAVYSFNARFGAAVLVPGTTIKQIDIPDMSASLRAGNDRGSKFTDVQAVEFASQWSIAEHLSDTKTGFSGTLFSGHQGSESNCFARCPHE